jgi:hypothetical protein
MTMWNAIAIGLAGMVAVSAAVTVFVAAVLGAVSRDVGELLEAEPWLVAEPTRARAAAG